MIRQIKKNRKYKRSEGVVFKIVDEKVILIPESDGVCDEGTALFTLADSGMDIWGLLDGTNTVQALIDYLVNSYQAPEDQVALDVISFLEELAVRGMIE